MPRPCKGARLYLRKGRTDSRTGRALPDIYFIRDGQAEYSTGCTVDRLEDAELELAAYITTRGQEEPPTAAEAAALAASRGNSAAVLISEVLTYYAKERAPELDSEAKTIAGYLARLGEFWCEPGKCTIADVKRSTCNEYVAWRTSQTHGSFKKNPTDKKVSDQTARRELEELSAAIGFWDGEYKLDRRPGVTLPEKRETQRDALTRGQAAALLLAAMGWQKQKNGTWKRLRRETATNRRHLRRFLLIGFYTGTRSKVITSLLWSEAALQAWVDLDAGMIYRRGKEERERRNKKRTVVRIPNRLRAHMRRWREADRRLEKKIQEQRKDPNYRLVSVIHFDGEPIIGRPRTSFGNCVADARLPAEITPHWLRHTCATWLMQGGANLWKAAGFTGMTPTMLEKNYGHHHPDFQLEASLAVVGQRAAPAAKVVSGKQSG